MLQFGKKLSIQQSFRPTRVDFCYILPLKNQQLEVQEIQIENTQQQKIMDQNQISRKMMNFQSQCHKDNTSCNTSTEDCSKISFELQVPKFFGKYLDDYLFLSNLGQGAYGRVEKLKNKRDNCIYAAKTLLKSSRAQTNKNKNKRLQGQIKVYQKLCHTNIPQLYEIYTRKNSHTMIMQYVQGSNLHCLMYSNPNEQKKIARIMYQILDTLEYLHSLNIVHHDIKPQNIIFDPRSEIVKIVDFGQSIQMSSTTQTILEQGGTFAYFAPEQFKNICSTKIDVWACGIILHYLLNGNIYFYDENRSLMKNKILQQPVQFERYKWNYRSSQIKDLILKMLQKDFNKRISAFQAKCHPWIVENCKDWKNPSKNLIKTIIKHARRSLLIQKKANNFDKGKIWAQTLQIKENGHNRNKSHFYQIKNDF